MMKTVHPNRPIPINFVTSTALATVIASLIIVFSLVYQFTKRLQYKSIPFGFQQERVIDKAAA